MLRIIKGLPVFSNANLVLPTGHFPARYAVCGAGDCMEPILPAGEKIFLFTSEETPRAGDFACAWVRADDGTVNGIFKMILETGPERLRLACLNPPRIGSPASMDRLVGLHKFVKAASADGTVWHAVDLAPAFRAAFPRLKEAA